MEKFSKKLNLDNLKVLFVALIIAAIVALAFLFKAFLSVGFLEKTLSEFLNLDVKFNNAKIVFCPNLDLNFKADELIIKNNSKTKEYAKIEKIEATIKPLGFLVKKANIKKFSSSDVEFYLDRDKSGKISLFEDINKKNLKFLYEHPFTLTKLDAKVDKISVFYKDDYLLNDEIKLFASEFNSNISKKKKTFSFLTSGFVEFKKSSLKSNFKININSKYPFSKIKNEDLKTDINIENVNLLLFNDLAKKYISKDIKMFLGNSNLYIKTDEKDFSQKFFASIKNQKIILKNGKTIAPYKKDIVLKALFALENEKLSIKNAALNSDLLNVFLEGEIDKIISKKPKIDLKIKIQNTQLNNFLYYIPDNAIFYRPQGIPKLKESNFYGLLDGDISLKLFPLDIEGNLKATDVHIPNIKKAYRQNDVNAYFMKDKMRIYTRVYTPDNEYVIVDGVSNLDDSLSGKYSVQSTKKIDLDFAQKYLVPIQQIIGFNIGPVPIMKIKGYGNIDIKTQGTLFDAQIFGNFNAYQAQATLDGLNAKLNDGVCELVFDNRNLIFKKVEGKLQDGKFSLSGIGNTKGEVELSAKLDNALVSTVLEIFEKSAISERYNFLTKKIAATSGKMTAKINLKGTIKNYEDEKFLNDLDLSGLLEFKNDKIFLKNKAKINSLLGFLEFGKAQKGSFNFKLGNSKVDFSLNSKDSLEKISKNKTVEFNSKMRSNKLSLKDVVSNALPTLLNSSLIPNLNFEMNISSSGLLDLSNFNIKNLKNEGYIKGLNDGASPTSSLFYFKNALIRLKGQKAFFENFDLILNKGELKAFGNFELPNDLLNSIPKANAKMVFKNVDLDIIKLLIPNIKFEQALLKSGELVLKNDSAKLSNINVLYDSMPLYLNMDIKNIFSKKYIQGDFSTILSENTADTIINPYLTYPIKIKEEVPIKASIKGNSDNYAVDFLANIPVDSDISFYGANLGDTNIRREILGKIEVKDEIAKINNLKLIKYIANQNNKINPIETLRINGAIRQKGQNFYYDNLKIVTNTPINVRILNLLFKKSLLKKGNLECDLSLNGDIKLPSVLGKIFFEDLDIPLYDTKINNINFNLSKKYIKGLVFANNKNSDLSLELLALNSLKAPFVVENLNINSNLIDVVSLLNSLSVQAPKNDISKKQEILIKPQDVVIKNGSLDIKEVKYEKITAKNLKSDFYFKDNNFYFENSSLDIAQGQIMAHGKYGLNNTKLKLLATMNDCSAEVLTKELFHMPDQFFGKINGSIDLSGSGLNTPDNIKNIKANVDFSIKNGKMPKLGSLEYLLRAGNIIKSGVLSLSINNLIQILTPYKTGEFENISGKLTLSKGIVDNLEISTKGKNMSLFLEGDYDILRTFADIQIYGKLSQNVSNAMGAIGNASIKQFLDSVVPYKNKKEKDEKLQEKLNKIPSVENETPQSLEFERFFSAKVQGDINKDNYIKSFKWE